MNELTDELIEMAREKLDTGTPIDYAVSALFESMASILEEIADDLNVDYSDLYSALFDEYNNMFIVHTS